MTDKQTYYLGIILSYAVGLLLTPVFFVVIGFCRLVLTALGIAYDTFMFTPRVVNTFIYRHYEQEIKSNPNRNNLN
mgnify:FL=1